MKEEKVRIRVRLTEEENQKLEHDSALCGLSQSEYVRQLCVVSTQKQSRRRSSGR